MLFGLISPNTPVNVLVAGDSVSWSFYDAGHLPADGWAASLVFNRDGSQILTKGATPSGNNWIIGLVSTDTQALAAGITQVFLVFTRATERVTEYAGTITIAPNPTGTMTPTPAMLALTGIKNTITTIVSNPESSASFNGQTYTMQNLNDLFPIRDRLQAEVNAEFRTMGITVRGSSRTILFRFR